MSSLPRSACTLLLVAALAFCALLAYFGMPYFRLYQAERELNFLYSRYQPIAYRWQDAPPPSNSSSSFTPLNAASPEALRIAATLLQLRPHLPANARCFVLLGRLSLITGQVDDAVLHYRHSLLLAPGSL